MAPEDTGSGQGDNRVNRGGSWNNNASNCRAANRNRNNPGNRNNNLGFRPAPAPPALDRRVTGLDGTGQRPSPDSFGQTLNQPLGVGSLADAMSKAPGGSFTERFEHCSSEEELLNIARLPCYVEEIFV